MRCPKCGKDVELQNKQVGVDKNGEPIFNEYAICKDCKKQWNLDKQRAKKAADAAASNHIQPESAAPAKSEPAVKLKDVKSAASDQGKAPMKTIPVEKIGSEERVSQEIPEKKKPSVQRRPSSPAASQEERPVKKRRPAPKSADTGEIQQYSNIPPKTVRAKSEKAVRQNYEDMLATDPGRKSAKKKKPAASQNSAAGKKTASSGEAPVKKKTISHPSQKEVVKKEEPKPKFKVLRIIFGIISIIAFGFFAYQGVLAGLNNISSGKNSGAGITYIILALCMLVSGLLLLIMHKKRTIFAFVLPIIFYAGGAVVAFLKRADDKWLLYSTIVYGVLALVFLILAIISKSGADGDQDEYEDPFE
ncbi:MAG: hypothetical protein QM793_07930 [Muricomes sp.]